MLLEYLAFAQCSVAYVPTGCPVPKAGISLLWGSAGLEGGPWGALSCHQGDAQAEQNIPNIPGGHVPVLGCHISPVPMSPWATRYDMESSENSPGSDKGKERSLEDLNKSTSSSPTQGFSKTRPLTVR